MVEEQRGKVKKDGSSALYLIRGGKEKREQGETCRTKSVRNVNLL